MKSSLTKYPLIAVGFLLFNLATSSTINGQVAENQFVNGDALPDAPELALRGDYKIGVRTIEVVHKNQIDILNAKGGAEPLYDRKLKLEVWYPAIIEASATDLISYDETRGILNDPKKPFIEYSFSGRALRDAAPLKTTDGPFPLIIVSHGYVGSRLLMTYLTENLASKGYVVVSIDHQESTYQDAGGFQSTLLNRSRDILYVLAQIDEFSKKRSSFLSGIVDANNTGLIGYSMGGYGVLNAAGAGYSSQMITLFGAMAGGSKAIEVLTANNPVYQSSRDSRIKAVVAFAPWGMERGVWDAEGLKGLKVPVFFIAGSQDDVSGYEKGTKAIYTGAVNSDRYLLTYINARHNVAPNAPPKESLKPGLPFDFYYHYAEPAWDQKRLNNINQHFVTAFMGIHLRKNEYSKYLDFDASVKTWPGFKPRTSVGLELVHSMPVKPE